MESLLSNCWKYDIDDGKTADIQEFRMLPDSSAARTVWQKKNFESIPFQDRDEDNSAVPL